MTVNPESEMELKMKKLILALIAAATLAVSAAAQLPANPLSLYLQGGISSPQSDFNDSYKQGYFGGLAVGLHLLPGLEIVAVGSYHSFDPDFADRFEADGGRFTALLYGLEGKFNFGRLGLNPYVSAGAGIAKVDWSDVDFKLNTDELKRTYGGDRKSYLTVAAGLEFKSLFVQARYVKILDDIELANLSADVNEKGTIVFIPVSVGLKF